MAAHHSGIRRRVRAAATLDWSAIRSRWSSRDWPCGPWASRHIATHSEDEAAPPVGISPPVPRGRRRAMPPRPRHTGSSRHLTSVWCTKQHAEISFLCVSTATRPPAHEITKQRWLTVHTTASASTTAYKRQISSQLENNVVELDESPVALQLAFTVGLRRNWTNLWKATIDSLDLILGRTDAARLWHPPDGRITELGLHCQVDGDLGNDVLIAIAARRQSNE